MDFSHISGKFTSACWEKNIRITTDFNSVKYTICWSVSQRVNTLQSPIPLRAGTLFPPLWRTKTHAWAIVHSVFLPLFWVFLWLPSGEQLTLRGPWVEWRVWGALCVSVCCFQLRAVWENSPPSPKNLADKRASLTGIAAASPPQQNKQQHIRTAHPWELGSRLSYSLCFPANFH